ncbi:hypothetical protein Tco_0682700 [Tanacetum coccineum]|uniref:Uncharacterized protein n=1 Tax=Tanacetum coccineum TaxID=301880 RepID=A0ABQ4XSZ1_9ASTR
MKSKSFEEIQKLYKREKKWINDFVPMDSEVVKDNRKGKAEGSRKKIVARKRTGEKLNDENVRRQKIEDDVEKEDLRAYLDIIPGDDEAVNVESLATKYPIVDWKTHILTENMMYYQIISADGSSKNYKIFSEMLDDFDGQYVLDLYRLVKERFETASPEGYDRLHWGDLITVFEPIHVLLMDTGITIHMLIEKTYPLTKEMLSRMPSRRLEADHKCEMAYELLRCVSGKSTDLDRLRPSRAQILWGMFYQKNVGYVALLWEDFMFQADNREISFTHDTLLGTLKFVSKTKDYQKYGALIPEEMINQAIKDSKEYKTYLKFASGKATPKKARKFKNIASPSEKLTPILEEEPAQKPKRAKNPEPAKQAKTAKKTARAKKLSTMQTTSVFIRDTPGVSVSKKKAPAKVDKGMDLLSDVALLEAAQLKKVLKRSNQDTHMLHASGLGDGVSSQPKVPDELKDKTTSTNKGTGTIPGVPDVPKDQSKSENKSWEIVEMIMITKSDDEEQETQDDEYVHTPDYYVPTNEETNDEFKEFNEEEYEEIYGDVNISIQVKDDVQATQKTEGLIPSSSIFSDYAAKYLNFDNIPPVDIQVVSMLDINVQHEFPCTSPLLTIPVSVILEHTIVNPPKIVTTALSTTIYSLLSSLLPHLQQLTPIPTPTTTEATTSTTVVPDSETSLLSIKELLIWKKYLGTSLDDALHKVLQKYSADITKEHYVPAEIVKRLRQQYVPEKSTEDIRKIKMDHARQQQVPKETITSSDTSALEEFD